MNIRIRPAKSSDLPSILAITNRAIAETNALWVSSPFTPEQRREWMDGRISAGFPVLVAEDMDGTIAGFGSYGPFRSFEGYRLTVEHSLYVTPEAQGQGIGGFLLDALIEKARGSGMHVMVAAITGGNEASIRLHGSRGFVHGGLLPQTGIRKGEWLDLVLMYLIL
ncbi:N-acetyltransferase family protein [Acetobacter sp. AN02]|uniref:GNAT family N-acetyltransferase n=1 Tax=Acetobacter sp. AN02 TaxID=2894186 RepID=UPI0024345C09|nr:GNAT family N-acetyltransferase [Acetobacter sp. AN02]MDG6095402.1 N-acetyltransferase family protein [Acetobacter sp. AN02]